MTSTVQTVRTKSERAGWIELSNGKMIGQVDAHETPSGGLDCSPEWVVVQMVA